MKRNKIVPGRTYFIRVGDSKFTGRATDPFMKNRRWFTTLVNDGINVSWTVPCSDVRDK